MLAYLLIKKINYLIIIIIIENENSKQIKIKYNIKNIIKKKKKNVN